MDLVRVLRQEHLRMRSTISESSAGPTKKASSLQSLARESISSFCLLSLRTIDPVIDALHTSFRVCTRTPPFLLHPTHSSAVCTLHPPTCLLNLPPPVTAPHITHAHRTRPDPLPGGPRCSVK